nr:TonB-dependent receptor [Myxococcales bacterium]
EGRQVTLRGLGAQFTQTTLNGMVVPASTDGLDSSGGLNNGRSFDFNVFASELFNRIDINKSPSASIEEGGLAGSIDLYSPRPLDNPGYHVAMTMKGGYNLLTETADPRLAGLATATFLDNTLGLAASAAYTRRTVRQEGYGSVRWAEFDVGQSNDAWLPRLNRLDYFGNVQHRLGVTGTAQWKPTKSFDMTVDYLHSRFDNERVNYNLMAQFRNEFGQIGVENLTRAADGITGVQGEFSNVPMRTESRLQDGLTVFHQLVTNVNVTVTDSVKLHGIVGYASSDANRDQYRFNIDTVDGQGFSYDFSRNSNFPDLRYDFDLNDPSNYMFGSGESFVSNEVFRENISAGVNADWTEGLTSVKVGFIYNDRTVENRRLDASYTSLAPVGGEGTPVSPGTVRIFDNFGRNFAPSGTTESFLVADFDGAREAWQVGAFAPTVGAPDSDFIIQEQILSGYFELNAEADLLGRPLRVNGGVRVARTEQNSTGFSRAGEDQRRVIEVNRNYVTALPSANFVWEVFEQLQLRIGISRSMTRPGLGSLSPGATVDTINREVTRGNPLLDPILATNVDTALEWYFTDKSMFAVAFFYKDIESFIGTDTITTVLDPTDEIQAGIIDQILNHPTYDSEQPGQDPLNGQTYQLAQPINNDGAELSGVEVAFQTPFFFLPSFLSNFGVQLNYTYVDSESQFGTGDAAVTSSLLGLSNHSYNGTLYYEGFNFGGRLSVNGRTDFVTRVPGRNGSAEEKTDDYVNVATLLYYDILRDVGPFEYLTVTFEGFNLTDQAERLFVTGNGSQDLVREYNHTGRQFFLGVRARI